MVRKTLEELCDDQGTRGATLADRIKDLKSKVMLPVGMLDGLDNLRLLGNDAAHVVLKTFDQIGKQQVEVGILLAQELLKAVYQSRLLTSKLESLKQP